MNNANAALKYVFALTTILLSITIYWLNIDYVIYGIDFTDEGFYLNWIFDPFNYQYSISNFGFVYNIFYEILNENIVYLRRFNVLLIGFVAFFLSYFSLKKFSELSSFRELIFLSFILSSLSLSLYSGTILFLPSPSYNDLNFIGLLVVLLGWVVSVDDKCISRIVISALLISLGGLLLFYAKPTTAVLVGFFVFVIIMLHSDSKFLLATLSIALFFGLLLLSSYYVGSGPFDLYERYVTGVEIQSYLKGGHDFLSILRFDDFALSNRLWVYILCLYGFIGSYFYFDRAKKTLMVHDSVFILMLVLFGYFVFSEQVFNIGYYQGTFLLILSLIPIFYVLTMIFFNRHIIQKNHLIFFIICIIFVYSYAFGTNGNYFTKYHKVFFFIALAGVVVLSKIVSLKSKLIFLILLQAVLILNILKSFEKPYRQPQPLEKNMFKTEVRNSQLILSEGFNSYINDINSLKKFRTVENFIDLSGQMPLVAYVLNLKPVGVAWLLGGYKGSDDFAYQVIRQAGCDRLVNSVVLYEPDGPRSISLNVLAKLGLNLKRDFKKVLDVQTPSGAGGYKKPRAQEFYLSIPESILRNCHA